MTVVLDASALLAYLHGEPGADVVERAMIEDEPVISAVNLSEVISKLLDTVPADPDTPSEVGAFYALLDTGSLLAASTPSWIAGRLLA